jgi:GNAT superfamily N-acetyltransferase
MTSYTVARLTGPADESRLQELLERCSDHYLLHEGWPTPEDAAAYELSAIPEGGDPSDLRVLALASETGDLVAVAQLMRNYPADGEWWIGMLVVAPSERGRGVGAELVEEVTRLVRAEGGGALHLAVSMKNPRGKSFWERLGFLDTQKRSRVTARNGHVDEVWILSRPR